MEISNIKWITLKILRQNNGTAIVEIVGLFSTEERAIQACKDINYLIGPLEEDVEITDNITEWTGSYYPLG